MAKMTEMTAEGPIVRTVRMIRLLAEVEGEISVKDAAAWLDLPASSTHRMLQVLQAEGIVEKNPSTHRYGAGLDLERLGSLLASRKGFREVTRPYLQRVVDECNEACMFVAYLPTTHQVSIMEAINSSHPLRYEIELYVPHSVAWGATGRSILAFLPEDEQRAIAAKAGPSPVSGESLPPWPELLAELQRIRSAGYVVTHSQKLQGAVGIGAPVRNGRGEIIGSFCITIPEIRFDPRNEERLAAFLCLQAAQFSASAAPTGPSYLRPARRG